MVDAQGPLELYVELTRRHGLEITDVMDTHIHADHRSASRALAAATGARLHLGAGADVRFAFLPMQDGDDLNVGNRRMRIMHTPGHTPEHVALFVDDWFVLTGDTLFVGDVGRVDLAVGEIDDIGLEQRARMLHSSLRHLLELEDHIEVYPGHYAGSACGRGMDGKPTSTIGHERRHNQAVGLDEDAFVRFQSDNIPPLPDAFNEIKRCNITS